MESNSAAQSAWPRVAAFATVFLTASLLNIFVGAVLWTVFGGPWIPHPRWLILVAFVVSLGVATMITRPRIGALWPVAAILLIVVAASLSWIAFVAGHVLAGGDLGFGND